MDKPASQHTVLYSLALTWARRTRAVSSSPANPQGPEGSDFGREESQWTGDDSRELQAH